jgi:Fe-S-cluster-containing dehydrogenase component
MANRVVVDLDVLRDDPAREIPCVYLYHPLNDGVAKLREIASFEVYCRRCELASCVEACPRTALERNADGVVVRHNLRCIGCMSCARACPFGTIMDEALRFHQGGCDFCESLGAGATPGCVEPSGGAVSFREVSEGETADGSVTLVGDRLAVKTKKWLKVEPPPKAAKK